MYLYVCTFALLAYIQNKEKTVSFLPQRSYHQNFIGDE